MTVDDKPAHDVPLRPDESQAGQGIATHGTTSSLQDKPKPFLEHLDDLRSTLLWSIAVLALGMIAAIPLAPGIFRVLRSPLANVTEHPEQFLRSLEITGGFSIAMQIVFWSGLLFSTPFLTFFIARFVFPGLTARERKAVLIGMVSAVGLFVLGVILGYFISLPVALRVMFRLHDWLAIRAEWTATNYVGFTMRLLIAFGLAFELPIVVLVLGYLGILSSNVLRAKRRHAIVIILVLAMILTPGPDVFSQLIMGIPMILLYELCIWTIRFFEKKKSQA